MQVHPSLGWKCDCCAFFGQVVHISGSAILMWKLIYYFYRLLDHGEVGKMPAAHQAGKERSRIRIDCHYERHDI